MTFSEIRSAYQVSQANNIDVYIGQFICLVQWKLLSEFLLGSTHIITPESFIRDLSNLDRAGPPSSRQHAEAAPGRSSQPPQQEQRSGPSRSKTPTREREERRPDPRGTHHPPPPQDYRNQPQYSSNGREDSRQRRPTDDMQFQPQYQQQQQNFERQNPQGLRPQAPLQSAALRPPQTSSNGPPPRPSAQNSFNFQQSNDSRQSVNSQGEPKKEKRGLFGRSKK